MYLVRLGGTAALILSEFSVAIIPSYILQGNQAFSMRDLLHSPDYLITSVGWVYARGVQFMFFGCTPQKTTDALGNNMFW